MRILAPVCVLTTLAACGAEPRAKRVEARAPAVEPQVTTAPSLLDAMGYAGYATDDDGEGEGGLMARDPRRSEPGYTLVSNKRVVDLVDPLGEVAHTWSDPKADSLGGAVLLSGGEVLANGIWAGTGSGAGKPYLVRIGHDGRVRWRKRVAGAHHTVCPTPAGDLATLTYVGRREAAFDAQVDFRDDRVTILSRAGDLLAQHSIYDMLSATEGFVLERPGTPESWAREGVELFHSNAISYCTAEALHGTHPAYAPQGVLITVRNQHVVAVFDLELGRATWVWGRGELLGPHDAQFLDSGNVLIFDNGRDQGGFGGGDRGYSRVVEVDPRTDEIVWEYSAPGDFYSKTRGSVQRLAGGTTLVGNSNSGEVFEITPDGDVVWRYLGRRKDAEGRRELFFRARRHPRGFVEGWLAD